MVDHSLASPGPYGGSGPNPTGVPAIAVSGVAKAFGPVQANRDVTMTVEAGTIHGLIGENGAGKSTLVNILYGLYQADEGSVEIYGQPARFRGPSDAIAAGIGMVHQHFMLIDTFTVLENVILGQEDGLLLGPGLARARATLKTLARDHELGIDPDAMVGDLPVGLQQRVEVLKALYRGADILILDEPTAVLTPQEVDHLFAILRGLAERGRTILLITHKLREVEALTSAVTVMRQGTVVDTVATASTTRQAMADMMVGRRVSRARRSQSVRPGEARLAVSNLTLRDSRGVDVVKQASFEIRAGEIVALAGVSGNGQSELLEALAGLRPPDMGQIIAAGRTITADSPADPTDMRDLGLAHVPEDRLRMGIVRGFPAAESAILGYHRDPDLGRGWRLDHRSVTERCRTLMRQQDVRPPDPGLGSDRFSGGNQQKLVLAREIQRQPDILLVGQPTRGVDIGAIEAIHSEVLRLADAGRAILLVSVELDEVLTLADRILVIVNGTIVGEVAATDADERLLGLMIAGSSLAEARATLAGTSGLAPPTDQPLSTGGTSSSPKQPEATDR